MNPAASRFGAVGGRLAGLRERRVPTVLIAALLTLLTWRTSFGIPINGLDMSWGAGLYLAIEDGIGFGSDIVFTYGPLGFLNIPVNWDTDLTTLTFIWQVLLQFSLCLGLVWTLRRSIGGWLAFFVTFLAVALFPFIELPFPIALALCYLPLRLDRPRHAVWALVIVGAVFGATLALIKLSIGPVCLALFFLALLGARATRVQLAAYLGLVAVSFVTLWLASGQALGDIPDYVLNGRQIISGYSEAMATNDTSRSAQFLSMLGAVFVAGTFTVGAAFASYRDPRARWFGVAVAALFSFVIFKEGIVRMDSAHLSIFFSTVALSWLVLPWDRVKRSRVYFAIGTVALFGLAGPVANEIRPGAQDEDLDFPAAIDRAFDQTDQLLNPGERTVQADLTRIFLQYTYGLDPETVSEIEGHSVSIEPWEIGIAWAYEFDWDPLPVIQGYSAYTSELDELNADAVASEDGPERVLRSFLPVAFGSEPGLSIDTRYPYWDPPAQTLAELCHFERLNTNENYQVLGRVPDRCSEPVQVGSVEAQYGETVDVPEPGPGQVVYVEIDGAAVSGLESLRALLYKAKFRYATLSDGKTYRLVPDTAADGLILRGDPRVTGEGTFGIAPQTETITLTGPSGDLRYDFYAMDVATTPEERADARALRKAERAARRAERRGD